MKFSLENLFDLKQLIRHLSAGLQRLRFNDNFEGFEATIAIPASTELKLRNQLSFIPTKYIITQQKGNGLLTAGDTAWSANFIYMKNHGPNSITATVFFMR